MKNPLPRSIEMRDAACPGRGNVDLARSTANGPHSTQRHGFAGLAKKCKSIAQRETVSL
ncbi:MAG TPA: hypothetical protein VHP36_05440 [Chitinispirillaceae bacterium]|nr:hypothetical protein [Chitinispirillaceae bacterium]